jgi:aspartate ammonia-lyase
VGETGTARAQPSHRMEHDLRLLSSGPAAGFGDITLPAVQAGSSIMPGKVNPVTPELVNQIAFTVIGHPRRLTGTAGPRDATATRQPAGPPTTITGGTA